MCLENGFKLKFVFWRFLKFYSLESLFVNHFAADGYIGQHEIMTKSWEINETMANGYSSDSAQEELSNEYQDNMIKKISNIFFFYLH